MKLIALPGLSNLSLVWLLILCLSWASIERLTLPWTASLVSRLSLWLVPWTKKKTPEVWGAQRAISWKKRDKFKEIFCCSGQGAGGISPSFLLGMCEDGERLPNYTKSSGFVMIYLPKQWLCGSELWERICKIMGQMVQHLKSVEDIPAWKYQDFLCIQQLDLVLSMHHSRSASANVRC